MSASFAFWVSHLSRSFNRFPRILSTWVLSQVWLDGVGIENPRATSISPVLTEPIYGDMRLSSLMMIFKNT